MKMFHLSSEAHCNILLLLGCPTQQWHLRFLKMEPIECSIVMEHSIKASHTFHVMQMMIFSVLYLSSYFQKILDTNIKSLYYGYTYRETKRPLIFSSYTVCIQYFHHPQKQQSVACLHAQNNLHLVVWDTNQWLIIVLKLRTLFILHTKEQTAGGHGYRLFLVQQNQQTLFIWSTDVCQCIALT